MNSLSQLQQLKRADGRLRQRPSYWRRQGELPARRRGGVGSLWSNGRNQGGDREEHQRLRQGELQERLAKLSGGVAVIHMGAATETETTWPGSPPAR
jgi:hypothetical protein